MQVCIQITVIRFPEFLSDTDDTSTSLQTSQKMMAAEAKRKDIGRITESHSEPFRVIYAYIYIYIHIYMPLLLSLSLPSPVYPYIIYSVGFLIKAMNGREDSRCQRIA
jgi:hypothetical protein